MNIGILTYHWVSNFGANLQALSTYKYLENHGYNPIVINWVPERLEKFYQDTVSFEQNEAHHLFKERVFKNITTLCRDEIDIARVIDDCNIEIVIIGSDAVFSTKPLLSRIHLGRRGVTILKPCEDAIMPNPFWGSFIPFLKKRIKVVALSVSAQNSSYRKAFFPYEKRAYRDALSRFSYITVRDIWTQRMVSFFTGNRIIPNVTPDPVFGFEQNVNPGKHFYVKKMLGLERPYVLLSVSSLSPEWQIEVERLFDEKGLDVVGLPRTTVRFNSPLKQCLSFPLDPLDWYDAIKCSSGYIGELMHPVLVSLHNSVPVYVFDTYGFKSKGTLDIASSKTYQIVKKYRLLDCYYNRLISKDVPSPRVIVQSIMSFNKERESTVSYAQLLEYNSAMQTILTV